MDTAIPLPTFFVVGAAKAGTTSLNNYLRAHPEIEMAEPREPHLMVAPGDPGIRGYVNLFSGGKEIRGDCSPGYSVYPYRPAVSEHIRQVVPEARLIYLVRDPVERVIAYYAQTFAFGKQRRSLEEAVDPSDSTNYYMAGSSYATQLEVYLRRFDQEQILVLDQHDLRHGRRDALRRVFDHVSADPDHWDAELELEFNVRGRDTVSLNAMGNRLRTSPLNRMRAALPTTAQRQLAALARRAFGRGAYFPEVRPEFEERLAEALAPEAERLRMLTQQRFASWSV